MKTVKLEVEAGLAREWIEDIEKRIADRMQSRDHLNEEIEMLQMTAKSVREQVGDKANGERRPKGHNKQIIKDYLSKLPNNRGAGQSDIARATNISVSSTAYTLNKNTKDFVFEESDKIWKLKP